MKNILFIFAVILLFYSCKESDLTACIEVSTQQVKVNEPIEFNSCTQNADFYEWDFDNGDYSNDKNTSYTYIEAGEYVVNHYVENDFSSDYKSIKITVEP